MASQELQRCASPGAVAQFPPVGGSDAGFSSISAVETGLARPLYGWFQSACPPVYNFPAHQRGIQLMPDVTQILNAIEQGDPSAAEQLLPLVYDELRKLAAAKMAQEKPGQTLQATALVHEAYIRLVDVEKAQHWDWRGHFFAAAAEAMRRILVEKARRKAAAEARWRSARASSSSDRRGSCTYRLTQLLAVRRSPGHELRARRIPRQPSW